MKEDPFTQYSTDEYLYQGRNSAAVILKPCGAGLYGASADKLKILQEPRAKHLPISSSSGQTSALIWSPFLLFLLFLATHSRSDISAHHFLHWSDGGAAASGLHTPLSHLSTQSSCSPGPGHMLPAHIIIVFIHWVITTLYDNAAEIYKLEKERKKRKSLIMALTEKATAALGPTGALHSKGGLLAENVTVKYDSSPGLYIILMLPLPFACPFFLSPANKWRKIQPFVIINSKQISSPESG